MTTHTSHYIRKWHIKTQLLGMPCNSSNVFLLTIRLLVINILTEAVGRNLVQSRKSNQSKSSLFCLCVFFLEPTNAKRSVIGRSASVPWSWSALRRPHQLRELSQTQPFNLRLLTFSLFCSLSSIVVPAEVQKKKKLFLVTRWQRKRWTLISLTPR